MVSRESHPDLAIPDRDSQGVCDEISLSEGGTVSTIEVEVQITHTFIGDPQLVLRAPGGRSATLRRADLRPGRDLQERYSLDTTPELRALVGGAANGEWTLCVSDLAAIDVGTLDSWRIEVRTS